MKTPAELERYLHELEKALAGISTSERAEIVTEIKSHVMESMQRDPSQSIEALLHSLGEPTQAANRYLIERGIQPRKPPRATHTIFKWLTIGFLGTLAIIVLGVVGIIWKFSPIMKVDEKAGRVTFLGGLIDIAEKDGRTRLKAFGNELEASMQDFTGREALKPAQKLVALPFSNGEMEIAMAEHGSRMLEWRCRIVNPRPTDHPSVRSDKDKFTVDLSAVGGSECQLRIPEGVRLEVQGQNGKVHLEQPRFSGGVKIVNGEITFEADQAATYNVEGKVMNGQVDPLPNDPSPDAHRLQLSVQNGGIRLED